MANTEISLCKKDILCLCDLRDSFSEALGREVSPVEAIEICMKVLNDKVASEGILPVLEIINDPVS